MGFSGWLSRIGESPEQRAARQRREEMASERKYTSTEKQYLANEAKGGQIADVAGKSVLDAARRAGKSTAGSLVKALNVAGSLVIPYNVGVHNSSLAAAEAGAATSTGDRLRHVGQAISTNPIGGAGLGTALGTRAEALATGKKVGEVIRAKQQRGDLPEGYIDPLSEMRKPWTGEKFRTGYDMWHEDAGVQNELAATGLGIATDIGFDPATWVSSGYGHIAEQGAKDALIEIAKTGVNAEKMGELGLDITKYGPEVRRALEAGETLNTLKGLPTALIDDITRATRAAAGAAQQGAPVTKAVPFLRKMGDGTVKPALEVIVPSLRRIDEAEQAARAALKTQTISNRLAQMTGVVPTAKRLSTLGDAASDATRVTMKVGERAADRGGLKIAGQTIIDAQPAIEKIGSRVLGGLRAIEGFNKVEGLVNPVAEVAQMNNPIATEYAKDILRTRIIGKNVAKNDAIAAGRALAELADDRERNLMSFAANEVISPEARSTAGVMKKEADRVQRELTIFAKKYKVDPFDAEAVDAVRASIAEPSEKLAVRAEQVKAQVDALKGQNAEIVGALGSNAGRTAYTVGKQGARKAGEAAGAAGTVQEIERTARAAQSEFERLASEATRQMERADGFAGRTVSEQLPTPGSLADAAGISPDEYRTPLRTTTGGKPKRYQSWQANLNDEIYGGASPEAYVVDARISKSGTKVGTSSRMPTPEELGSSNPEQVVDILSGRVRSALDAGDIESARLYQQHLDDYAEWYSRPQEGVDFDPFNPQAADVTPGTELPVDKPTLMADYNKRSEVVTAAQRSHDALSAAYKRGRATGAREAMLDAARGAIRAEGTQAAAEGRMARYYGVIRGLGTDAERFEAAAEVLRRNEAEIARLSKTGAVLDWRHGQAVKPLDKFSTAAGIAALNTESAPALREMTDRFVQGEIDMNRYVDFLVEHGVERGRAVELSKIELDRMAQNEMLIAARKATGTWDPRVGDKLAPGAGGVGYVVGATPSRPGMLETLTGTYHPDTQGPGTPVGAVVDRLRALTTPKTTRTRNEVIAEVTGVDPSLLRRENQAIAGIVASPNPSAPRQVKEAVFPTLRERIVHGGLQTETDIAQLQAQAYEEAGAAGAKAAFQDSIIRDTNAHRLRPGQKPAQGFSALTVTRDGKSMTYEVPAAFEKWASAVDGMFTMDESTQLAWRTYDRVLNGLKRQMTSWNPAFHGRNLFSNYWMAWAGDSADPHAWEAATEMRALGASEPDKLYEFAGRRQTAAEWRREALEMGVEKGTFGPSEVKETIRREVARDARTQTVGQKLRHPVDTLDKVGGDVGTAIEDTSRLAVYLANLDKGMSKAGAAREVDRILYNYSGEALTPWERTYMKRAIPFYSWMRANLPRMIEVALTRPGKLTSMAHIRENLWAESGIDRSQMPSYYDEAFAMPVGGAILQPGLPFTDLNKVAPNGQDAGVMQTLVNAASPVFKNAFETVAGVDTFTGRPLATMAGGMTDAPGYVQGLDRQLHGTPTWEALKRSLGMDNRIDSDGEYRVAMNAKARKALKDYLPFFERLGNNVLDPVVATPNSKAYWLTGVKTTPYDPEKARRDALYRENTALDEQLKVLREQGIIY